MYKWRVCPIQGRQLKDVREEDLFEDFRICNTYRGGGGYDKFPIIAEKRFKGQHHKDGGVYIGNWALQFVVQLYGCHLDCPYCYVTRDGIWGKYNEYTTLELIEAFARCYVEKARVGVFHLMGGSPALYIKHWHEIINEFRNLALFHSDLLLTEKFYTDRDLESIVSDNALYAVNIKGVTIEDYYKNTGRILNDHMFWHNLRRLQSYGVNYYITFTNPDKENLDKFRELLQEEIGEHCLDDSFVIDLVQYEALTNEN